MLLDASISAYPGGWCRLVVDPRGFGTAKEEEARG
jgi:hypothetical protein